MRAFVRFAPVVAVVAILARAHAQPADAIGKPLPDPKLKDGTVMLRVIAGDPNKPVSGVEATIMLTPPDGISDTAVRRARTDTDGRVTFTDVPPDTVVMLKAPSEASDSGEVMSSQFPMPAAGGVRVMISTVPVKSSGPMMPGSPGGPTAGGGGDGGGPPSGAPMTPRAMSGQGRGEDGDPADRMTVRLSYDDFADKTPPADVPVLVVGYRFDLHVDGKIAKSGPDGRAVFDGLDRRGATTYFAMTLLPRGNGGEHDRLISAPLTLPGDDGVRLVLSGDKRDVTTPVDDLGRVDPQPEGGVPAGVVQVTLAGLVDDGDPVELVDAITGKLVSTTKAGPPVANPASVTATWDGVDDPALAVGALALGVDVNTARGVGARVEVRTKAAAAPASAPAPAPASVPGTAEAPGWTGVADPNGEIRLTGLPVGVELDVLLVVDAMTVPVRSVTLPKAGGRREQVRVQWQPRGQGAARFTNVAGGPERAYFVRAYLRGQPCLSPPFQLTATRGAGATVLMFPRILFGFSLRASIHDVYMGARGTFTLRNSSLAPFIPGTIGKPEELVIPLPKGFIGATVDPQFAEQVGVDATRGFIVRQPVPPGGMGFVGHFSLETSEGRVRWDLDLPYGTLESGMEIKRTKDMKLDLGPKMPVREANDERGSWYVLSPISVQPRQRMVFTVTGLPQPPAWTRWSRNIVGLLVLVIVLGAIGLAVFRSKKSVAVSPSRYDALLDELAALGETTDPETIAKREKLLAELEALHRAKTERAG